MDIRGFLNRLTGRAATAPDDDVDAASQPDEVPASSPPARQPAPAASPPWKFQDTDDGQAAIYALIIAGTEGSRRRAALQFVAAGTGAALAERTRKLYPVANSLEAGDRMAWIDDALTRLRAMQAPERDRFLKFVAVLIDADKRCTLPEFTLSILLRAGLQRPAPASGPRLTRSDVVPEMRLLLSLMARVGADDENTARRNLSRLMFQLTGAQADIAPQADINTTTLTRALERLCLAPTLVRESFVGVVAECVTLDGRVKPLEKELLAAVCARLGVRVPPLDFANLSRSAD